MEERIIPSSCPNISSFFFFSFSLFEPGLFRRIRHTGVHSQHMATLTQRCACVCKHQPVWSFVLFHPSPACFVHTLQY